MKFCSDCGTQLADDAAFCIQCGHPVKRSQPTAPTYTAQKKTSDLTTVAKVFMVIGTVVMGLYILPLAWCIPMTVYYFNKVNNNEPIGVGFKVCTLLFVSQIAVS